MSPSPTVSIVIPTFNEERHLEATLRSVHEQTYASIVEIIVADGRSTDATREIAATHYAVRIVDNPLRIQSAGLNRALDVATGEIVVRVDGHCVLAPDYVEQCVAALESTGAALVGGAMTPGVPVGSTWSQRGIASAMRSRLGAGPARFHVGGCAAWVDTVYLGAYRLADARAVGGYAEHVGVNEDAELAIRLSGSGGVWFDPLIRSEYVPRQSFLALTRQFYRYGSSRAATVHRHPRSLRPRQLAAPLLVLGLLSPRRRQVAMVYATAVALRAMLEAVTEPRAAAGFGIALPVMHVAWGAGFFRGIVSPKNSSPAPVELPEDAVVDRSADNGEHEAVIPSVEPAAEAARSQGLTERADSPSNRVHRGDRPRQMRAHEQQAVS